MRHPPNLSHEYGESMDWEPSPQAALVNGGWTRRPRGDWDDQQDDGAAVHTSGLGDWDNFGTGKQRMFAGHQQDETGLESLLAGWGIGGNSDTPGSTALRDQARTPSQNWTARVYALFA